MSKRENNLISIVKLDAKGQEQWRYPGRQLRRIENAILVEAFFNREDTPLFGMHLCKGDRFLEVYYSDRWFNIFEIYDAQDKRLKGWYCNVTEPAEFHEKEIAYHDLALDLLVFPDGRQQVLDEEEFDALGLCPPKIQMARGALRELQGLFASLPDFRVSNLLPLIH
jgi:uncharacterized protein